MSSYLHGCQPTMCKVTGLRPSRKVMSLNHITVIPGIGKPKYVHTYLQKICFLPLSCFMFILRKIIGFSSVLLCVCIDVKRWPVFPWYVDACSEKKLSIFVSVDITSEKM